MYKISSDQECMSVRTFLLHDSPGRSYEGSSAQKYSNLHCWTVLGLVDSTQHNPAARDSLCDPLSQQSLSDPTVVFPELKTQANGSEKGQQTKRCKLSLLAKNVWRSTQAVQHKRKAAESWACKSCEGKHKLGHLRRRTLCSVKHRHHQGLWWLQGQWCAIHKRKANITENHQQTNQRSGDHGPQGSLITKLTSKKCSEYADHILHIFLACKREWVLEVWQH